MLAYNCWRSSLTFIEYKILLNFTNLFFIKVVKLSECEVIERLNTELITY